MTTTYQYFSTCYLDVVGVTAAGNATGVHKLYGVIAANPQAWAASTAVTAQSTFCLNGGNAYQCVQAGTTAASGGPTGTGTGIVDGTAKWNYAQPAHAQQAYWWWGMPESAFNGTQGVLSGSTTPPLAFGSTPTEAQCLAANIAPINFNIGQVANQAAAGVALGAQWTQWCVSLVATLQAQFPQIAIGPCFTPAPVAPGSTGLYNVTY